MPVPFLLCGGPWLGCTVVPVMGALFQSRGWLPIVEVPGYSRHPTSILEMQLLITPQGTLKGFTSKAIKSLSLRNGASSFMGSSQVYRS